MLSFAALATSAIAVVFSSLLAQETIRLTRKANHLPVIVDFLEKHRSANFIQQEENVWKRIRDHDPALGFSNLPEPLKSDAIEVALFYQAVAYIVLDGLVEWKTLVLQVHYRATKTWSSISPHVAGERTIRGAEHTFLNSFESFVHGIGSLDMQALSIRPNHPFK